MALPRPDGEPIGQLRIVTAVVLALCGTFGWAQPQQPKRFASSETVARMPQPKVTAGELPRPCADSPRNMKRLQFDSPATQSRWAADPSFLGALQLWSEQYFRIGRSDYLCQDMPFVVGKFQEASGDAPTGQLRERDLDRLEAALTGTAAKPGADALARHDTSALAVRNLPKPSFGPGELPRPCAAGGATARAGLAMAGQPRFASDDVRSLMAGFPTATLLDWVRTHFRYANDGCIEWDYVVRKFQAASGTEVTGIVSRADQERLSQSLEQGRQLRQETTVAAEDKRRTLLDFLPAASNDPVLNCRARAAKLQQPIQARVDQRVQALPPQMKRSAVFEQIAREVKAEYMPVAPQWAEYWASRPVLQEWARRGDCEGELHFKVELWQAAIGAPVDARDAQSIARTEEVIARAQGDFARFSSGQNQRFAAEAAVSGETSKARTWVLDELSSRTRLRELAENVPTALCQVSTDRITCAGRVDPCANERKALASAGGGTVQRQAELDRDLAAVALRRCEARSPYSAAAQSRILLGGQEVQAVELSFDAKGLAAMRLTLLGEPESVRTFLTRRYGNVETQQEMRTGVQSVATPGQPVYVPGVGTGYTLPSIQQAPVTYTQTRYIWAAPSVRVEESGGEFTFRFLQ